MSLIALKFVFAGLFAMLMLASIALAREVMALPDADRRVALWILGIIGVLVLAVVLAPTVGEPLWRVFGK